MLKIRKLFNAKIISLVISIVFLCNATPYAYPDSRDTLRVPVSQKGTYQRMGKASFEVFKEHYGASALHPVEALAYLQDGRTGDRILVWRGELPDGKGTEFISIKDDENTEEVNTDIIAHIQNGMLVIYYLDKPYRGRKYILVATEKTGGELKQVASEAGRLADAADEPPREIHFRPVDREARGSPLLDKTIEDLIDNSLRVAEKMGYELFGSWAGLTKFLLSNAITLAIENAFQHNNGGNRSLPVGGRVFYDNDTNDIVIQVIGGGVTELLVDGNKEFWAKDGVPLENISDINSGFGDAGRGIGWMFENLSKLRDEGLIAPDQDISVRWHHLPYRLAEYEEHPYNPVVTEIRIPLVEMAVPPATALASAAVREEPDGITTGDVRPSSEREGRWVHMGDDDLATSEREGLAGDEQTSAASLLQHACESLEKWIKLYYIVEWFRIGGVTEFLYEEIGTDDMRDLQRISEVLYQLGHLPTTWMESEPYANTLAIVRALDLRESDPVIEIGPNRKIMRYIALAAAGHPVLVVEEPNILSRYKDKGLLPFLAALEILEPETFGKARQNMTIVGADILTDSGRQLVESEWRRIRGVDRVDRAGSVMALHVFWGEAHPERARIGTNVAITGIFREQDIRISLRWIKNNLLPRVVVLSDPDNGPHLLWDLSFACSGTSIDLPGEPMSDAIETLVRYRFPRVTPPATERAKTAYTEEDIVKRLSEDRQLTMDSAVVQTVMSAAKILSGEKEPGVLPEVEVRQGVIEPISAVMEKQATRGREGEKRATVHNLIINGTEVKVGMQYFVEIRWSNGRRIFIGDYHNLLYYFLTLVGREELLPQRARLLNMDAHQDGRPLAAHELPPALRSPLEAHARYAVGNWQGYVITPEIAAGYINDPIWLTNGDVVSSPPYLLEIQGLPDHPLLEMLLTAQSNAIPVSPYQIGSLDLDVFVKESLFGAESLEHFLLLYPEALDVLRKCRINAIFTSPWKISNQAALPQIIEMSVGQVIELWQIEDGLELDPRSAMEQIGILFSRRSSTTNILKRMIREYREAIQFLRTRPEAQACRSQSENLDAYFAQYVGEIATAVSEESQAATEAVQLTSAERALRDTDVSYGLDGIFIEAPDGRKLSRALYELGWVEEQVGVGQREGKTFYNFKLDPERIDIVAFKGGYVEKHPGAFLREARRLLGNRENRRIPVILAENAEQERTLLGYAAIAKGVSNKEIFIIRLSGRPKATEEWSDLVGRSDSYDFSNMEKPSETIIKNMHLIQTLATAK